MTEAILFLKLLVAMAAFRIRGSTFTLFGSEQLTRLLVCALPWGLIWFFTVGGPLWALAVYVVGFFIGIVAYEWGPWTAVTDVTDFIALMFRGLVLVLIPAYVSNLFDYPYGLYLAGGGMLMGVAYWLGKLTPSTIPNLNQGREMGELYTALLVYLPPLLTQYFS